MANKLSKLRAAVDVAREHRPLALQAVDLIKHKLLLNIAFIDYYRYRFHDPGISWEDKRRYVCEEGSICWPYQENPLKFTTTLSNKYIQKHLLIGFGLPSPPLLFTVGESMDVRTRESFAKALGAVDHDFVLKPVSGAGGSNVRVISNREDGYYERTSPISIDEMWAHISKSLGSGYLVEKRVKNAAYLEEIFPNCLNTYRVITIKTRDGKCHAAHCVLKVGRGDCQVDNVAAGGFVVPINKQGVTEMGDSDIGRVHPDTKVPIDGIRIENYDALIELGIEASRKFSFLGTIGWDIADTDQGPMIIEGNTYWGPIQRPMLNDDIMQGLKRNHWYSRWNKSAMYPGFHRPSLLKRLFR